MLGVGTLFQGSGKVWFLKGFSDKVPTSNRKFVPSQTSLFFLSSLFQKSLSKLTKLKIEIKRAVKKKWHSVAQWSIMKALSAYPTSLRNSWTPLHPQIMTAMEPKAGILVTKVGQLQLGVMTQPCNPSHWGGRVRRIASSRPVWST